MPEAYLWLTGRDRSRSGSHTRPHSANHSQVYVTQHLLAPDAVFWILYIDLFPRNLTK